MRTEIGWILLFLFASAGCYRYDPVPKPSLGRHVDSTTGRIYVNHRANAFYFFDNYPYSSVYGYPKSISFKTLWGPFHGSLDTASWDTDNNLVYVTKDSVIRPACYVWLRYDSFALKVVERLTPSQADSTYLRYTVFRPKDS